MQDRRRALHRKLINSTVKKNKVLKKNEPEETMVYKHKPDVFDHSIFVYSEGKDSIGYIGSLLMREKKKIRLLLTLHPLSKT